MRFQWQVAPEIQAKVKGEPNIRAPPGCSDNRSVQDLPRWCELSENSGGPGQPREEEETEKEPFPYPPLPEGGVSGRSLKIRYQPPTLLES